MNDDYYRILGVLPSAEAIVITAAYRALASKYHPDRWKGDPNTANIMMAEINVAYEVLGNSEKREAYDQTRNASHNTYEDENNDTDEAFEEAMSEQESKWRLACDVFPDLVYTRKRLANTSHRLAFAFVTLMLETKEFDARFQIAEKIEQSFLELHFGSNSEIVEFAKHLIVLGHKKAVVALNQYIDVLGSQTKAKPIIQKIRDEFDVVSWELERNDRDRANKSHAAAADRRKKQEAELIQKKREDDLKIQIEKERIESLKYHVRSQRKYDDAYELLRLSGYELQVKSQGFFKPSIIELLKIELGRNPTSVKQFENNGQLVIWVVENLCS
jgi:curved DNA-binding protein CbpA